ncbi:MAG: hypothetical protein KatS3mg129_2305 [Leptospiraceae bacterium]|nr:MAG: hypothetical protein KatS3mg129_2305 [Leptospiraceae bacterium]
MRKEIQIYTRHIYRIDMIIITMRFIQPDPVHTERTGFDNYDRYSYVNNNPVNYVDPDGRSFEMLGLCSAMMHISKCIHMGNEIMGGIAHSFNSFLKRNIHTFNERLRSIGSAYNKFTHFIIGKGKKKGGDPTLRKIGEVGNFLKNTFSTPERFFSVIGGILDYTVSLIYNFISGKPAPYITYHNGGFMIHNSVYANQIDPGSKVIGLVGHIESNASKGVIKHEASHIVQGLSNGIDLQNTFWVGTEYGADITAGIFNYGATPYIVYMLWGAEAVKAFALQSIYYYSLDEIERAYNYLKFYNNPELANPFGYTMMGNYLVPISLIMALEMDSDWSNIHN